ncbi:flagellar protein FlaG [Steroidobacter flavus]|uniref:Flagellar protein FlaG n=1 Tax=Steroidobacter flavus TaxID=1842136 RepID=A0ABV8SLQ3_9GAMM
MSRLDASQVEAGGEIVRSPRSPSFPQPTTAAEVSQLKQTTTQASAPAEPSADDVKRAAQQLEAHMQSLNRYLEFRIDQESGRTVVTVKDKATGETIRQIPSEEIMRLAHNLGGKAPTGLVDQTV